jgi:hypothetical protein
MEVKRQLALLIQVHLFFLQDMMVLMDEILLPFLPEKKTELLETIMLILLLQQE